jgi:hypothetical protein
MQRAGDLDAENRHYQQLSLQQMKSEIAKRLESSEDFLKVKFGLWADLEDLFSLINDGSEKRGIQRQEFYIPPYNGGLFDPEKNHFLAEKRVGDYYLARAIDLLSRSNSGGQGKGFVDYSSLEIRHLGSIYEGILEYRLKVADQELVAIKEKGREVWLPREQAGPKKAVDRADAGSVYLVTDKGERKATGLLLHAGLHCEVHRGEHASAPDRPACGKSNEPGGWAFQRKPAQAAAIPEGAGPGDGIGPLPC